MFCPECGAEYRGGFTVCADCDRRLVEQLPLASAPVSGELATVLEAYDQSLIMLAKGLLDSVGIPYFAKNDQLQDLFGLGRLGPGFNVVVGPVRIQVPEEHAEAARAVLKQVDGSIEGNT